MAEREALTAAYLRSILHYDPETGEFRWKERTPEMFDVGERSAEWRCRNWNSKNAGRTAGVDCGHGYIKITIFWRKYYAHRLAWLYMTGEWPTHEIDHLDLIRSNNRFDNLRCATRSENEGNKRIISTNTSGFKGVSWDARKKKWCVQIGAGGTHRFIGYFDEDKLHDAAAAYANAARKYHGEFARLQ